ncbi:MAG: alpha/beta fold hydrolase [Actinomycetota bacterium]
MTNGIRRLLLIFAIALIAAACNSSSSIDSTTEAADEPSEAETEAEPTATPEPEPTATPEPAATATPEPEPAADDSEAEAPANDVDDSDADDDDDQLDPNALAIQGEMIDWVDCGRLLQCGTVEVPIDYNDPSLGTIDVAVNVRRSENLDERIGYLFVNPGGPGGPGTDLVVAADFTFQPELLDAFDIIGFDPRGTGGTAPTFACGVGTEQFRVLLGIEEYPDTPEEIEVGNDAAQLCVESMGPLATRMGTQDVVRDMDEIRKALGADQISYLGFSYGSTIGGWYASEFPDNVYSMVVDGAGNPLADSDDLESAIEVARDTIEPIHAQFEAALATCDSDACPIWNDGDPEGYWYEVAPKMQLVADAKEGNGQAMVLGLVGHLYSQSLWPQLHQSIFDLGANDDPSGFIDAIDNAGSVDEASVTAHINCLDSWALFPDETLDEVVAESKVLDDDIEAAIEPDYPLLFAFEIPEQASACLHYASIGAPAYEGTYDGGDVPILVVGNTSDPITPFVQSEQFANDVLTDGRLLRVEHPQHVVYPGNPCVVEFVHAALIDQDFPDDDPICPATEQAGLASEVELVDLELPNGAMTVIPDGWLELGPGIFAPSADPLDPVVVVFQPTQGDPEGAFDFLVTQLPAVPELVVQDAEIGGALWDFYSLDVPIEELTVRLGVRKGPDGVIIIAQAFTEDIEQLTELVLNPIVEAYQP